MLESKHYRIEGKIIHPPESPSAGQLSEWIQLSGCNNIQGHKDAFARMRLAMEEYDCVRVRLVKVTRKIVGGMSRGGKGGGT